MLQLVFLVMILLSLLNFGHASLSFYDNGQTASVPLKALHVQGEFFDSFGEVFVRQLWSNNHVNAITSKYKFSLDTNAVISGFEMKIGNQSWTGVVKVKSIAREQFDQAVETGTKSSLLEKISDNEYQVEIGPIPPSETAAIEFHYLTHAAVQLDGSYRFVLPTNIAPKYIDHSSASNQIDKEYADKMASTPYASQPPYTFDVDLTWHSGSALRGIVSPTNEIRTELLSATAVRVRCTTAPAHGDFSLLVTTGVTTGAYSYQNDEGATYLYVHSQIPTEVVPSTVSAKKITIVVDRSGSMDWLKIREAVAAMDKFLSLLPPNPNTLINVVSFGSHFDALYSHSVPATASNIDVIRQRVRTFDANYGGTQLSECLKAVVSGRALPSGTASAAQPEPSNMEHVIVLHQITNDLSTQKATTSFRIMSVGIGRDADRKLVQQVADTTHGLSRMLADETDLTRTLTDMLAYIDKQYYTDVTVLDYAEASQCSQVLYPAHPVDLFLRLSPAQYQQVATSGLTITAKDPLHRGSIKVWHVPVIKTHRTGRLLEKLYADHTISQLSKQIEQMDSFDKVQHDIAHLTESIVALSVKHGIMNKHTSYLVVSDEQIDAQQLAQVQPVEVPQHHDTNAHGGRIFLTTTGTPTSGNVGNIFLARGTGSSGRKTIQSVSSWEDSGFISINAGSSSDSAGGLSFASDSGVSGRTIQSGASWEGGGRFSVTSGSSSDGAVGSLSLSSGSSSTPLDSSTAKDLNYHGSGKRTITSDPISDFGGKISLSSGSVSIPADITIASYARGDEGSIAISTGSDSSKPSGEIRLATGSGSTNVHGGEIIPATGSDSSKPSGEIRLATGSGSTNVHSGEIKLATGSDSSQHRERVTISTGSGSTSVHGGSLVLSVYSTSLLRSGAPIIQPGSDSVPNVPDVATGNIRKVTISSSDSGAVSADGSDTSRNSGSLYVYSDSPPGDELPPPHNSEDTGASPTGGGTVILAAESDAKRHPGFVGYMAGAPQPKGGAAYVDAPGELILSVSATIAGGDVTAVSAEAAVERGDAAAAELSNERLSLIVPEVPTASEGAVSATSVGLEAQTHLTGSARDSESAASRPPTTVQIVSRDGTVNTVEVGMVGYCVNVNFPTHREVDDLQVGANSASEDTAALPPASGRVVLRTGAATTGNVGAARVNYGATVPPRPGDIHLQVAGEIDFPISVSESAYEFWSELHDGQNSEEVAGEGELRIQGAPNHADGSSTLPARAAPTLVTVQESASAIWRELVSPAALVMALLGCYVLYAICCLLH